MCRSISDIKKHICTHPSLFVSSRIPVRSGQNTEQNRVTAEGLSGDFFRTPPFNRLVLISVYWKMGLFTRVFRVARGERARPVRTRSLRRHLSFICFGRLIAIVRPTGDCFDVACQWLFSRTNGLIVDSD